jgi:hypothetical protein
MEPCTACGVETGERTLCCFGSSETADFTGKKDSLQTLVLERESSKKGLPYFLGEHKLSRAVCVENSILRRQRTRTTKMMMMMSFICSCRNNNQHNDIHPLGTGQTAIDCVFEEIAFIFVRSHPGQFLGIVDVLVVSSEESAAERAAGQNPTVLSQ